MKATVRAARASFRVFWPELLCSAILTAVAFAHTRGAIFLAVFSACLIGIGWAMGIRHRRLPVHERIDRLVGGVEEIVRDIREDRDEPAPPRRGPALHLVRSR